MMTNAQAAVIAAAASMSRADASRELTEAIAVRAAWLKGWLDDQDEQEAGNGIPF